jgi:peroxiredoxin
VYEKYRDKGLAILSINVNWDKEADAKRFIEQYLLPFPVGRDARGLIAANYGVESTPNTFFIGKDGRIVGRVDTEMEEAAFEQRINSLLSG